MRRWQTVGAKYFTDICLKSHGHFLSKITRDYGLLKLSLSFAKILFCLLAQIDHRKKASPPHDQNILT